jgi:alpha-L-arabinofuranosidase
VWLQPPGYVLRMISRSARDAVLPVEATGAEGTVDVTATRSGDGKSVAVRIVNLGERAGTARIRLEGFVPTKPVAGVEALAGALDARNTAADDARIKPTDREWRHGMRDGTTTEYPFPPHSFTVLRFE